MKISFPQLEPKEVIEPELKLTYVGLPARVCGVCSGGLFWGNPQQFFCATCDKSLIPTDASLGEWLVASPTKSSRGGLRWAAGSPPHDQSKAAACVLISGELEWLADSSFDTLRRIGVNLKRSGGEYRNDTITPPASSDPVGKLAPPIGRIVDGESLIPLTPSVFRWILGKIESIEANGLPGDGAEPTSNLLAAARESVRVGWLPESFADVRTWPTSANGVNPFAALDFIRDQLLAAEASFARAECSVEHQPRWFDREMKTQPESESEMAVAVA